MHLYESLYRAVNIKVHRAKFSVLWLVTVKYKPYST
jgi:hypothetical protein